MRIGIFGGSFNPPHNTHLLIAKTLLKENIVDKIIFVPTGIHYEYKNNLLANSIRYQMVKLMIQNEPNLEVSDVEFKETVVHTYETLQYFQKKYKQDEIYFICGTDNWNYLKDWDHGEDIIKNYKIIIIQRNNQKILNREKYQDHVIQTNIKTNQQSSTEIRKKIKNKENIQNLVHPKVFNYIYENKLYEEENE